jgi:hypothetical protein
MAQRRRFDPRPREGATLAAQLVGELQVFRDEEHVIQTLGDAVKLCRPTQ